METFSLPDAAVTVDKTKMTGFVNADNAVEWTPDTEDDNTITKSGDGTLFVANLKEQKVGVLTLRFVASSPSVDVLRKLKKNRTRFSVNVTKSSGGIVVSCGDNDAIIANNPGDKLGTEEKDLEWRILVANFQP